MRVECQTSDSGSERVSKQLDALMDEITSHGFTRLVSSDAWEPQWNIYEGTAQYLVCVDLAGMRHAAIDVHVDKGTLRVSGYRERPEWPQEVDAASAPVSVHVMEIDWGRFERTLAVPPDVDTTDVTATYRNGYLWIVLRKRTS